ncbi:MAG TPA: L,D-transpeptidase family protein [Ktedonobacteraceae bacterium]|nr:L,D-transpeptidase family protein [Ktedonobacteraceae bacterium]
MNKNVKKLSFLTMFALLLAILLALSPTSSVSTAHASSFSRSTAAGTWTGATTGWANVRSGPTTNSSIVTTDAPNTSVTVYATVSGQIVWGGISNWYRISDANSAPQYIYGGLVNQTSGGSSNPPAPSSGGNSGTVASWANVRSGPNTSSSIVTTDAPGTTVTIYQTVSGQAVWGGISNWYRISSNGSTPQYIYSALVTVSASSSGGGSSPSGSGKTIVISLSASWLHAYENGKEVLNTGVVIGRPDLPTPTGTFHIFAKLSPTTFYSPWPVGSPYYYAPTHINFAMEFAEGGYFLHDSYWHTVYGPGTNVWHYDPVYGWQWGSHGCVTMPYSAAQWLYNWAPIGTTVQINP